MRRRRPVSLQCAGCSLWRRAAIPQSCTRCPEANPRRPCSRRTMNAPWTCCWRAIDLDAAIDRDGVTPSQRWRFGGWSGAQFRECPSLPLNCFAASQPRVAAEVLEDVAQVYRHGDRQNTSLVPDRSRWIPRASGHEGPASEEAGKFNISLTHRTSRVVGLSIVWIRSATRSD